jgi:hypothetical protein
MMRRAVGGRQAAAVSSGSRISSRIPVIRSSGIGRVDQEVVVDQRGRQADELGVIAA